LKIDGWVIKTDSSGNIVWEKNYGGEATDKFRSIEQTNDGGYIVAGYTESNDGDFSENHGGEFDSWVVKLDSSGNLEWQKILGGSGRDQLFGVVQGNDGNYVIAGLTTSNDGDITGFLGSEDFWIIKLGSTGNLIWEKTYGGSSYDFARSIANTADGGYIVAGGTFSEDGDVTVSYSESDYWIIKLDVSGNLEWEKTLGGNGTDSVNNVKETIDGGYIAVGSSTSIDGNVSHNNGKTDLWTVKLDAFGNLEWEKALGGSENEYGKSVVQNANGEYIIVGDTSSNDGDISENKGYYDCWIVKLSSTGTLISERTIGGASYDNANCINRTNDNSYIIAARTASNNGDVSGKYNNNENAWIIKLAPTQIIPTPTPITEEIIIDGDSSDWVNIPSLGSGDADLDNMYAVMDSENLYIMVEGLEVKGPDNFYIDTDFNDSTGHPAFWWDGIGAEFVLEQGNVFKYINSSLKFAGLYEKAKNGSILEIKVPLSVLEITNTDKIRIGYYSQWGKYFLPSKGEEGFVVN
jgi:hypothetical protein